MNSLLLVAIYLLPGGFFTYYLIPPSKSQDRTVLIARLLVSLIWPLWVPFVGWFWIKAYRARPDLKQAVNHATDLIAAEGKVQDQINDLIEALAAEDTQAINSPAETLKALTSERQRLHVLAGAAVEAARTIYNRHRNFWAADPKLPPVPEFRPHPFSMLPWEADEASGAAEIDEPSIIYLTGEITGYGLSDDTAERLANHLASHAFLPERTIRLPNRIVRYMRVGPSPDQKKWVIILTSAFKKSAKRVGPVLQKKIEEAVADLLVDPVTPKGDTISRLTHDKRGLWRYRIGDYRLIYMPMIDDRQLVFVKLAHRNEAYH